MTNSPLTSQISHLKSPTKHYAIIVAGGSGTRVQSAVPKQFLLLNGIPVLMHTIEAFYNCIPRPEILIVLHPGFHDYWKELCTDHQFTVPHRLIPGGETRFHSVKNGLDATDDDSIIAIHDAVRPLTDAAVIEEAYKQAAEHGNAVVAVKSRDSIRQGNSERSVNLLRDEIYLIQTPQTFRSDIIKKAYKQPYQELFTDDASVAEHSGIQIKLIDGSYSNIKITFPEDIAIAELLLKQKSH